MYRKQVFKSLLVVVSVVPPTQIMLPLEVGYLRSSFCYLSVKHVWTSSIFVALAKLLFVHDKQSAQHSIDMKS